MVTLCLVADQLVATQNLRANEDTGLVGAKLAAVEKTHDLFTFFNLARTGNENLPDHHEVITFKPTGPAFHPLATLSVTIDERGTVERLRLEVARSFIDDTKQGIFAADLVKSFFASVGSASAKDDIMSLANEIHARAMINPGRVVLTAQPTPAVSKQPSAAYLTYVRKGPAQTLSNRSGSVQASLENKEDAGTATLDIVLSAVRR